VKRKRIFPTIAGVAAALTLLVLAGCCNTPQATDQTQNTSPGNYQQNALDNTIAQQGVHQISSQKAREIAIDFVGYGVVHDVLAFTDEGTLIFEVDVRHNAMRYVVLLNAESGNVTSLSRHEDELAVAVVSPDATIAPNEHVPQTANETTNAAIAPNERAPQTLNETTNAAITPNARAPQTASETTNAAITPNPQVPQTANEATQSVTSPSVSGRGNRPSTPAISLDNAIEIAYADLASRGINATYRSNSGMEWERGQWVWELLFRTHGERMPLIEYYINVDNGNIVKFEWDD